MVTHDTAHPSQKRPGPSDEAGATSCKGTKVRRLVWWAEWLICRTVGCGSLLAYHFDWPSEHVCARLADNRPTARP